MPEVKRNIGLRWSQCSGAISEENKTVVMEQNDKQQNPAFSDESIISGQMFD